MEFQFRKAGFGGFHRQDVVDYLEQTAAEHSGQMAEMESRILQLEEENKKIAQLEAEKAHLQATCDTVQEELATVQTELSSAQEELIALRATCQETEQELARLTPDAQAYRGVKDRAAGMELEAHVRAQKIIDDANFNAQKLTADSKAQVKILREDLRQWMEQMKQQYKASRGELNAAVLAGQEDMKKNQKSLELLSQVMCQKDGDLERMVSQWTKKLEKL